MDDQTIDVTEAVQEKIKNFAQLYIGDITDRVVRALISLEKDRENRYHMGLRCAALYFSELDIIRSALQLEDGLLIGSMDSKSDFLFEGWVSEEIGEALIKVTHA